jgi:hypothetical protein
VNAGGEIGFSPKRISVARRVQGNSHRHQLVDEVVLGSRMSRRRGHVDGDLAAFAQMIASLDLGEPTADTGVSGIGERKHAVERAARRRHGRLGLLCCRRCGE